MKTPLAHDQHRSTVDLLIRGAAELVTCRAPNEGARGAALNRLEVIRDGAIAVAGGRIVAVGTTAELDALAADEVLDARGRLVSPGLVDPHSHLVHAGSRHHEFEARVTGRPLDGRLPGGIAWTAERTREASDEALVEQALRDLDTMLAHGTTTLEAKTGYGFERADELRLLALTAGLRHPVDVIPTYLGAHVLPPAYAGRREAFVDLVVGTLPEARRLADSCDVCCDPIGFTAAECRRIGEHARELGFRLRVHADQTGNAAGAQLAAELGAASADHLDRIDDEGIRALAGSATVGVLLPGVTHHMLEMTPAIEDGRLVPAERPYMPLLARRLIDAGVCLALSCDYNPGSCPSPSMQATMQLGARLFRLAAAEAWHMATINAARALDRAGDRGSLEPGKRADLLIWEVPEHGMVLDRFGTNLVHTVIKDGRVVARPDHRVQRTSGGAFA